MKITLEIPTDRIVQLMSSAIEGGDPVTTARKGGWCSGIYWKSKDAEPPAGWWYSEAKTFEGAFRLEIVEVDDESTGHETSHKVGPAQFAKGLATMAKVFPHQFAQIMRDEIDAPCADAFLQSMLFGDEKYA